RGKGLFLPDSVGLLGHLGPTRTSQVKSEFTTDQLIRGFGEVERIDGLTAVVLLVGWGLAIKSNLLNELSPASQLEGEVVAIANWLDVNLLSEKAGRF